MKRIIDGYAVSFRKKNKGNKTSTSTCYSFLFNLGPLTPLLFLLLSSLRFNRQQNISDFYSEAIATCLLPGSDCIKHTPLLLQIHLLHIQFQGFLGKLTNSMWALPFPLPLPLEASTTSLQGRLLFQLSCEECHLSEALK